MASPGPSRHRHLVVVRGTPQSTSTLALNVVSHLPEDAVLWIGQDRGFGPPVTKPSAVRSHLGQSVDAVVLDLHAGLNADVLGQCQGLIWGGGCLVLRLPPKGERVEHDASMAVHPYTAADQGRRFWDRLEKAIAQTHHHGGTWTAPRPSRTAAGTQDQASAVATLATNFCSKEPTRTVLLADRGRGKSSALGLALRSVDQRRRIAVVTPDPKGCEEVLRFASDPTDNTMAIVALSPWELREEPHRYDLVLVDEAARCPLPVLKDLVQQHPQAHMAFATTAQGYEGTGRGFVLKFLHWLRSQSDNVFVLHLNEPIRWAMGDPVEALISNLLCLDARPVRKARLSKPETKEGQPVAVELDRDELARDPRRLSELFGLLLHAHYRTTPSDLHRMLDAPNLQLHAVVDDGQILAATVTAQEGGLSAEHCEQMAEGKLRIRGHALPDTLISHLGQQAAGQMRMVRSVRIATHPHLRRLGLARQLVDHVHRTSRPDLFGTLFGATPELIRFRQSLGYQLIRIGSGRGARTGEPTAVMVRPVSIEASKLTHQLAAKLARELPLQLALLEAEDPLQAHPNLTKAIEYGLPPPSPLTEPERQETIQHYLRGPQHFEAAAYALKATVKGLMPQLSILSETDRTLIECRVLRHISWRATARAARMDSVRQTQRALKRALDTLIAGTPNAR